MLTNTSRRNAIHSLPGAVDSPTEFVALVERARDSGDSRAFDEIVRRFQDQAVGYGASLLPDFDSARDAAQEAFLEAYRTLPSLRHAAAFPGWLRLLVRKHCDRRTRGADARARTVPLENAWNVADATDLSARLIEVETRRCVHAAVRGLPEGERAAVLLFYVGGRSLRETVTFLEVPVSVIKNRLYRARKRLKGWMMETMADSLHEYRPSKDDRFRERVFERLQDEFIEQFRADPLTADRVLLGRSQGEFERYLAEGGPLDADAAQRDSYGTLLDNVASPLADRGYTDLALRLFPLIFKDGGGTGWAHVRYAACLWKTGADRAPVLDLLRRGAPRELGSSLFAFFQNRPAFADVKNDPEFVDALRGNAKA